MCLAMRFDGQHHIRGRGEGIAALAHGHGASMAGQAGDGAADAAGAGNRGDHAQRQARLKQHRPLLDMRFDEGRDPASAAIDAGQALRVGAEIAQGLAQADALAVASIEPGGIESAGHGFAADQRDPEAHALFIAEGDHLDGMGQPDAALMQVGDAGDRREDAEQAVVATGIAHGVQMRAGHHDGRVRMSTFVSPDHVAQSVPVHRHAGFAHPARNPLARLAMLGGEVGAGQARGILGDRGQLIGARHDLRPETQGLGFCGAHRAGAGWRAIQWRAMSMRRHTQTRSWRSM